MTVQETLPPPTSLAAPRLARAPLAARATRVALVGTGYIADMHLEALREISGLEVVALCDVSLERARAAARRHGVREVVRTPGELVPHAIDVVHLCVPPDLHAALARECLELGFSVLVEKPLALSAREAAELGALAEARGLVLGVNHNSTFHPAFLELAARVQSGALGKLEHVGVELCVPLRQLEARDYSHWMFRAPANIVFEQAVHPFAQLVALIGRPREVRAHVLATQELLPGQPFHAAWSVAGRGERGTAQLTFRFGATFQKSTLSVLASDGTAEADLHRNVVQSEEKTLWLDFFDAYRAGTRRGADLKRGARRNLAHYLRQTLRLAPRQDAFYAGLRGSLAAFHAAYRAGQPPPAGAPEAQAVLEWCEACARVLAPHTPRAPLAFTSSPARAGEVVVLGANGFIGRHTLRALLAHGLSTTAAVRRAQGFPADLERAARAGELRLVKGDLSDAAVLAAAIRGARVVIHLATGNGASWEEVERVMVGGTLALAQACLAEKVERLVFASSIAALYLGPDCGASVVDDGNHTDPLPLARPPYARGKIAAEAVLLRLHREQGLAVTIVRPGVVLGADAPLGHSGIGLWVRDNHCVGWGPGNRPLPLVLVEDVADALARLAAWRGRELDGRALNLVARTPLTAQELVARFAQRTGRAYRFHPRALALSQTLEIGKWLVKRAGGRRDAFPSYRDLKSRSLWPAFSARLAREVLGWKPCEEPEALLARLFPGDSAPDAPAP